MVGISRMDNHAPKAIRKVDFGEQDVRVGGGFGHELHELGKYTGNETHWCLGRCLGCGFVHSGGKKGAHFSAAGDAFPNGKGEVQNDSASSASLGHHCHGGDFEIRGHIGKEVGSSNNATEAGFHLICNVLRE
jgi:hypothetical protein